MGDTLIKVEDLCKIYNPGDCLLYTSGSQFDRLAARRLFDLLIFISAELL